MNRTRNISQSFWRDEQLPWLELRSTRRSHQAYKRHYHPQLSVGAILEGETRCVSHGVEYRLQAGDLIVIPPDAPHSCNPVDGQCRSYHMLYLDADWCRAQFVGVTASARLVAPAPVIRSPSLFADYLTLVTFMARRQTAAVASAAQRLLRQLPLHIGTTDTPRASSRYLLTRLQSDLLSPPSLDELAHECQMRKETLIRTFKQDIGLTPGSYLNIARIGYARARLRAGETIADVSYQSGFADQSHFHRTFVSYTAATPRQYASGRSISDNN
ncbi:AraC family transcriptional regulator [Citrobacter sedlakii]|uniref:AraC family transcriptional regulator n=1 Tax=Citrobacter sedlakii TaxID=67826 RepID=A0ABS0ZT84_9ENTR|nr:MULTISPECIES: AraC family transcriptional regulator [Citrobacter]KSY28621.1 AraC family transcriptional regulator [Citrobacter sp. 50677481]MBJ8382009.1 AraC family transcriptional regulator [Citrobacter sedlakii]MBJ9888738.1 AraC family transcriptional regulator [Citrobacter sedlakii]MCK8144038.1 AraC family transcriptional regulator [Citrobacter sedlakii]MDM2750078.1 AraC family transcriptional regulator [Citrobacter sp. Cs237]